MRRTTMRLLLVGALIGGLYGQLLAGAPTAAAAPPLPTTGAVFNDPTGTPEQQNAVKQHIIDAIDQTEGGRTLRASMYALTDTDYSGALQRAHARKVQVRVVLDHSESDSPAAVALTEALGTDMTQPSWVHICPAGRACIADTDASWNDGTPPVNPINHNKFFTFSRVGAAGLAEDVVIQTSANQTPGNTTRFWNNAYTSVGNTELYTAYVNYFNDLAAERRNTNYFRQASTAGAEKYYFFPQSSGDLVVDILDNVTCTGNTTVGSDSHKTVVRIAAWALHRSAVAQKLRTLADQNCWIEIVYRETNQLPTLTHPRIRPYKLLLDKGTTTTGDDMFVHSKYLLVEGNYAGHPDTKWTFTGSHNLDLSSLRENDEALLRIAGDTVHDAYRANYYAMRNHATLTG
ncbi:phospholipase D-like domain-containing protein [Streptomyces sp. CB02261]|uniref:phospholipase D-like domain-containing protein n=1 Tax=Streptomyces sp. CB02261 TaxID=1703940 RepID=UPI001300E598|nr:phospholipase D-like domain-containing protein [Streptomyces sp. CB02261]